MKIKKITKFITFFTGSNVIGITLSPFGIYLQENNIVDKTLIRHESIHWKQQMEMLIIFFYLWYVIEWVIRLFGSGNSYKNISFEKEANQNENNENYLTERKKYSWIKYL